MRDEPIAGRGSGRLLQQAQRDADDIGRVGFEHDGAAAAAQHNRLRLQRRGGCYRKCDPGLANQMNHRWGRPSACGGLPGRSYFRLVSSTFTSTGSLPRITFTITSSPGFFARRA